MKEVFKLYFADSKAKRVKVINEPAFAKLREKKMDKQLTVEVKRNPCLYHLNSKKAISFMRFFFTEYPNLPVKGLSTKCYNQSRARSVISERKTTNISF